jgi:hypothetical protein
VSPEWGRCRAADGSAYWVRHDGAFAIGPDGTGRFKIRKKVGRDWLDVDQLFPDVTAAKQYLRPPIDVCATDWDGNTVPAVGDRIVVTRGDAPGKVCVFIGRRIEDLDDGRFAVIEWQHGGWVELGRFDRLEDASSLRR